MTRFLTERVATIVDRETKEALERIAQREQRSESSIIRLALRAYLEKHDAKV